MSIALVEGVVSLVVELLVPGVVFVGELTEKVTRAFVGIVSKDFPRGIFEVEAIELISVNLFAREFWAESELIFGAWFL